MQVAPSRWPSQYSSLERTSITRSTGRPRNEREPGIFLATVGSFLDTLARHEGPGLRGTIPRHCIYKYMRIYSYNKWHVPLDPCRPRSVLDVAFPHDTSAVRARRGPVQGVRRAGAAPDPPRAC